MAEITERIQVIVDFRQEIYVDGVLADVNTGSYNSLNEDDNGAARFIIDRDLYNENAEAITETETNGTDLIDGEIEEIKTSLKKKGITENPNPQPVDPDSRDDDDSDDSSDDDSSDDSSGHGTFIDPGGDG